MNLLLERYVASIILTSVYVEALVKEAVLLKTGNRPSGGGGTLEAILASNEYSRALQEDDLEELADFALNVRNIWLHVDQKPITRGGSIQAWEINFEDDGRDDEDTLETIERVTKEAEEGKREPEELSADRNAFVAGQLFRQAAEREAPWLYEWAWTWGYRFIHRYLTSEDYERYRLQFEQHHSDDADHIPDGVASWLESLN